MKPLDSMPQNVTENDGSRNGEMVMNVRKKSVQSHSGPLENLEEYFSILRSSPDIYRDLNTESYKSRLTGKTVSKKRVHSEGVRMSQLMRQVDGAVLHPDLLRTAMDDYWPDLEMGQCEHPSEWFLGVAMGEIPYP